MSVNKTVLITGTSRGIGLLAAKTLAQRGHKVFASMRDISTRNKDSAEKLRNWATSEKLALEPIELDVTEPESISTAVATIENRGPIDVLINNAGIMPVGVTEAFDSQQVQSFFDLNVFGLMNLSNAVLPGMRKRKAGLLIHLSSAAGRLAIPYFGVYCSTKWAVEAYAESLHYELTPLGVESIIVEPSGHGTDLVETSPTPTDQLRLNDYGTLATGGEKLLDMFKQLFAEGDDLHNPQNVADSLIQLIEQDRPRPIRTQVGDDMGVAAINEAVRPVQATLIESLKSVYSQGDTN